ncbi:MAG: A/G-specific adenine glycosylase [Leptospirales bacterium]
MSLFDRKGTSDSPVDLDALREKMDWSSARRELLSWYQEGARPLPWRKDLTPYRIWVSEIMLQQTTVPTVIGFFDRFLGMFPDVGTLAFSPLEKVLKQWEGLGYYQRARNLHRAAGMIVERGGFPGDLDGWMSLPGIGRSTAGAICSIALGQATPILDANVRRVQRRLLQAMGGVKEEEALLWESSLKFVRETVDPGSVNQSLMELGARVCLPKVPRCTECPVALFCLTAVTGGSAVLPSPRPTERPVRVRTAIVPGDGSSLCLVQGTHRRLLEGLWDFLSLEGEPSPGWRRLGQVVHLYTHFREEIHVAGVDASVAERLAEGQLVRWLSPAMARDLPMTGVARKILSFLEEAGIGKQG